jgi:outer membrane protein assembly factor BamB
MMVSLVVLLAATVAQGLEPRWKAQFEDDIRWQKLTPAGNLVVSNDRALYGVDPESGQIKWEMPQFKKLAEEMLELVPMTSYAVITAGTGTMGTMTRVALVDLIEGKEVWDSKTIGLNQTFGQFLFLDTGRIMMYGLDAKGKKAVVVAALDSGTPLWAAPGFFKKDPWLFPLGKSKLRPRFTIAGNHEPVFDTPVTFITCMSADGVRKHDAATGKLLWTSKAKIGAGNAPGWGFAQMVLSSDHSLVFAPAEKSVIAVRTSDGAVAWKKPPKLDGVVSQMVVTPQGLLIQGGPDAKGKGKPFITVLDPATGAPAWRKPFKKMRAASNFVVQGDRVLICTDGTLYALSLADGSDQTVAQKIRFGGGEIPGQLSARADGYLLQSSQNVAMYGLDGSEKFSAYYAAPGASMFAKIASTAAIAAANAASAANAYSRAQATGNDQQYSLISSNPVLSKRFKATANTDNYLYILTDIKGDEKGPGLVKVNKNTGKLEKQLVLGTKEPEYEMDEVEARLFFRSGDREITCYDF